MNAYDDAYARERGRLDARRDSARGAQGDRARARRHFRGFRELDPSAGWFDPQDPDTYLDTSKARR